MNCDSPSPACPAQALAREFVLQELQEFVADDLGVPAAPGAVEPMPGRGQPDEAVGDAFDLQPVRQQLGLLRRRDLIRTALNQERRRIRRVDVGRRRGQARPRACSVTARP